MLAWKRGDLLGARQRLWLAAALAVPFGALVFAVTEPNHRLAAFGLALGAWLICGSLVELAERVKLGRAPAPEVLRRTRGLP
ncbi:cytochrome c-type biogenesis CcmF C-terminal domain-containing protein, partial [Clostridioides difficile]|uniref:cytochrome c-type biogenesis CcmF C-terminal domain-containing protein n=1 Tax=Clostridioides difficile TaxID=1496 RepID=UPI001F36D256